MSPPNVAIVTGGSRGIGAAICARMLDRGFRVISLARSRGPQRHARLSSMEVDLLDAAATARAAAEIAAEYRVTHFVHNAGLAWRNPIEAATRDELAGMTQIHVGAAMTLLQAVLPAMKGAAFGRVILLSSRGVLGIGAGRSLYAATKAAMLGLGKSWAIELAPYGITANVILPGAIQTEQFHGANPVGSPQLARLAAAVPVGRLGVPDDIANAVMFFAARESGYITGQALYVCGGTTLGAALLS